MKKHLPLIIQIIISALFLLSAVAKAFPIWAFEKQLVDLGIVDWCKAPYLARLIIALETAIAIAILQKNYLKSFVIPLTIALLAAFCIHLGIQMVQHGAMNGNCGCFGQLIPMTPLEAFIKNIITIALLIYLYKKVADKPKGENSILAIFFMYFLSAFLVFFLFPFCPCKDETATSTIPQADSTSAVIIDTFVQNPDTGLTTKTLLQESKKDTAAKKSNKSKDTITAQISIPEPTAVVSKFSKYSEFSGKKVNLDEGKKIVCLFVPGCDHCRDAAKELVKEMKSHKLPPVYILFMNEELFKIPEFFTEVKMTFPYAVIDNIPEFFKLLGNGATTPGVSYLWNGNIIRSYEGLEGKKFNARDLINTIESNKLN
jgi:hypothetical protein